ncbi:MAG: UrcA family protein [Beijerinckiaceae bacterium]
MSHLNSWIPAMGASVLVAAAMTSDRPLPVVATKAAITAAVQFEDLDVKRPAGVESLYERLVSAARRVCQMPQRRAEARDSAGWRRCYADVLQRAVEGIDIPLLTELYLRRAED